MKAVARPTQDADYSYLTEFWKPEVRIAGQNPSALDPVHPRLSALASWNRFACIGLVIRMALHRSFRCQPSWAPVVASRSAVQNRPSSNTLGPAPAGRPSASFYSLFGCLGKVPLRLGSDPLTIFGRSDVSVST